MSLHTTVLASLCASLALGTAGHADAQKGTVVAKNPNAKQIRIASKGDTATYRYLERGRNLKLGTRVSFKASRGTARSVRPIGTVRKLTLKGRVKNRQGRSTIYLGDGRPLKSLQVGKRKRKTNRVAARSASTLGRTAQLNGAPAEGNLNIGGIELAFVGFQNGQGVAVVVKFDKAGNPKSIAIRAAGPGTLKITGGVFTGDLCISLATDRDTCEGSGDDGPGSEPKVGEKIVFQGIVDYFGDGKEFLLELDDDRYPDDRQSGIYFFQLPSAIDADSLRVLKNADSNFDEVTVEGHWEERGGELVPVTDRIIPVKAANK